jgi:uncharacterized membrane protein
MSEGEDAAEEFRRRFWNNLCEYDDYLKAAVMINLLLIALLALASPGIARESTAFVVLIVDLVILVPLIVVTVYLAWRCRNRQPEQRF